jgi:ATP-dependent Clp protease ATP-binding subunit ClpC
MFERYTEKARRAIFFARCEAAQHGSRYIEAVHLLAGILRECAPLVTGLLGGDRERSAQLMAAVESCQLQGQEKIPTSVDLPLNHQSKRILAHGAEEAERFTHKHIGPEHLLLAILREQSPATEILVAHGITLEATREYTRTHPPSSPAPAPPDVAWPHDPIQIALVTLAQGVPEARWTAAARLLQGLGEENFEVSGKDSKGAFSFAFGPEGPLP